MRRAPHDREAYIEYFVRVFRMIGSPGFPQDEERDARAGRRDLRPRPHPAGTARQLARDHGLGDADRAAARASTCRPS